MRYPAAFALKAPAPFALFAGFLVALEATAGEVTRSLLFRLAGTESSVNLVAIVLLQNVSIFGILPSLPRSIEKCLTKYLLLVSKRCAKSI